MPLLAQGGVPTPDIRRSSQASPFPTPGRSCQVRHARRTKTALREAAVVNLQAEQPEELSQGHYADVQAAPPSHRHARTAHQQGPDRGLDQLVSSRLHGTSPVWTPRLPSRRDDCTPDNLPAMIGFFAKHNSFEDAIKLLQQLATAGDTASLARVRQKYYMRYAGTHKASGHALAFLKVMPASISDIRTYNLAMDACAGASDAATAAQVLELTIANGVAPDTKLLTTFLKVYMSVGAVDKAYAVYLDIKRRGLTVDAHVVGALLAAFAQAMSLEADAVQDRKNKLVLMERAVSVLKEAEDSGLKLSTSCWNSLMVCAGRCGQLKRAFEMLDSMQAQGLRTNAHTFGALMEACVQGSRQELAQRLFEQALAEGHTSHVELYTLAITACRSVQHVDWPQAMRIHNTMQRHSVSPDTKYYSSLVAVAGHAGHLEYAMELLSDMAGRGLQPDTAVCSALIYACCMQRQLQVARKVYHLCAAKGVYPVVSQYNRLMDLYASERRFGDVVSLLSDMTQAARLAPNVNTYRILINACQQTDQAALAFEVFAVMKTNRIPILQEKFAVTMYHTLLKCCLNMLRHIWAAHHPHPAPWASASRMSRPVVRLAEARQVLLALGSSLEARGASSLLLQDPSASTWTQYALSTYRDMLARGWRPTPDVLDKLMACLRLPGSVALQHAISSGRLLDTPTNRATTATGANHNSNSSNGSSSSNSSAGASTSSQGFSHTQFSWGTHLQGSTADGSAAGDHRAGSMAMAGLADKQLMQAAKYQLVFERRAVGVVEDAIARGMLPAFSVEQPCTLDLTGLPPTLAEVYTAALLLSLERRAARARTSAGAEGSGAGDARLFFHRITLMVPPYDPQYVMWPSYVPKLTAHQQEHDTLESESPHTQQGAARRPASSQQQPSSSTDTQDEDDQAGQHPDDEDQQGSEGEQHEDHDQAPQAANGARRAARMDEGDASKSQAPPPTTPIGHESTGLAVAATLRRLKFYSRGDPSRGIITLDTHDIFSWVREKRTWEFRQSGALNTAGAPQGAAMSLQRTQRPSEGMQGEREPAGYDSSSSQQEDLASRPFSSQGVGLAGPFNPAAQQRRIRLGLDVAGAEGAASMPHRAPVTPTLISTVSGAVAALPTSRVSSSGPKQGSETGIGQVWANLLRD